jgi:hypothetical protein
MELLSAFEKDEDGVDPLADKEGFRNICRRAEDELLRAEGKVWSDRNPDESDLVNGIRKRVAEAKAAVAADPSLAYGMLGEPETPVWRTTVVKDSYGRRAVRALFIVGNALPTWIFGLCAVVWWLLGVGFATVHFGGLGFLITTLGFPFGWLAAIPLGVHQPLLFAIPVIGGAALYFGSRNKTAA